MVTRTPDPERHHFATWAVTGASVRGVTHVRSGLPNQDALEYTAANTPAGMPAVLAVADGHGGARHFRSERGAQLAVQVCRDLLLQAASGVNGAAASKRAHIIANELPARIVTEWRDRVEQDLRSSPISPHEWQLLQASESEAAVESVRADPLLAYGATLLAALATRHYMILLQLGDGDILAVASDGTTRRPVPLDHRLVGNSTTSLCRHGAEQDFRTVVLNADTESLALVLLATDGYANSFRTDADFLQVGRDLQGMVVTQGLAEVGRQLSGFLAHASENGSGDDISVAILSRTVTKTGPKPAVGHHESAAASPSPSKPSDQPTQRPPSKWARIIVVLLMLGVLGWIAQVQWRGGVIQNPPASPAAGMAANEPGNTVHEPNSDPLGAGTAPRGSVAQAGTSGQAGKPAARPRESDRLVRNLRAENQATSVLVRLGLKVYGSKAVRCDLDARVLSADGTRLAHQRIEALAEPGPGSKLALRIELASAADINAASTGSVQVDVRCQDGSAEFGSALITTQPAMEKRGALRQQRITT